MRFIVMHKSDAQMESGKPPSQDIVQNMGAFIGGEVKKGTFVDGAGLHRSARRLRVRNRAGCVDVTPGPYAGDNELVTSFAMIKTRTVDEAVEHARRLAAAIGDCEIEVGLVVEGWDLTGSPKPAHVENDRFLLLLKGDAATEAGRGRGDRAKIDACLETMRREGVLLGAESLERSATGKRLLAGPKGKRTWTDGPFAESKELVAGFSIIAVPSTADALAWADRYAAILDGNEVDVRVVRAGSSFAR
jgi:hypothetical protein